MAKYARGYERKNSDTKNLIWLVAIIVVVIALGIGAVVIYNHVKKDAVTLESYGQYHITDFSKTLTMSEDDYLIYIYDEHSATKSDSQVLKYMKALEEKKVTTQLYLVNYDDVSSSSSDSTITANATAFKNAIKYDSYQVGDLMVVKVDKDFNPASQIYTNQNSSDKIISGLKALLKGQQAFGLGE